VLVVVQRVPPSSPDAMRAAAEVTGLAQAEVRTRLAGALPRVLLVEPHEQEARDKTAALGALGFTAIACDARAAPTDEDRLVARALGLHPGGLLVTDALGEVEELRPAAITLMQRGVRVNRTTTVTKKKERRLDLTRAVLSGGLLLTKKVEIRTSKTTGTDDPFLLLHRRDDGRDVIIYQHRIDYRFLGGEVAPSSTANFARLIARVRALAPAAAYDDRVGRPGVVAALPSTAANGVDLALWLVLLSHLRGGVAR
jgi:hypothetical protein